MNIEIHSEYEIYKVAFVTFRGWKLDKYEHCWTKSGVVRRLTSDEIESNEFAMKHNNKLVFDGLSHTLDQAFDYEEEKENA